MSALAAVQEDAKPYGVIYSLTNKITGKRYVGQTTKSLRERITAHYSKRNVGGCTKLVNALRKYGIESFTSQVVRICESKAELDIFERYYIAKYNTIEDGYNIKDGGHGGGGFKHTEEQKEKIRQAHIGMKTSEETKRKISQSKTGAKLNLTDERRKQIGEQMRKNQYWKLVKNKPVITAEERKLRSERAIRTHTGRKASEEAKRNMSLAHKGRKHSKESIKKMKKNARSGATNPMYGKLPTNAIPLDIDLIKSLSGQGMKPRQIAKQLGCGFWVVQSRLKRIAREGNR